MNHSSSGSLALRKAIIGFSNHKTAEGLTERSVDLSSVTSSMSYFVK